MDRFLPLILASGSPRRAELLRAAGIPFEVKAADVDETIRPGENAESYVERVAATKAHAISDVERSRPVVGADTVVVVEGRILGKPTEAAAAARMLELLSGKTHAVLTGVCLVGPLDGPDRDRAGARGGRTTVTRVASTTVEFAQLTQQEINWYVASGEPLDKAGAYAIQGLASRFITRIDGSYSNVVGLPLALLYRLCREAGILIS
jgi:septum formation protein